MARDPFPPSFRHEVDRLFDTLIHTAWGSRPGESCWLPPADVAEEADRYLIEMDLPGVRHKDLSIRAEGRILRIEGIRERARQAHLERHHLVERCSGRFVRTFQLPDDADPSGIRAKLNEGVLTIEIPRLT
jgi:HSP20 family protein